MFQAPYGDDVTAISVSISGGNHSPSGAKPARPRAISVIEWANGETRVTITTSGRNLRNERSPGTPGTGRWSVPSRMCQKPEMTKPLAPPDASAGRDIHARCRRETRMPAWCCRQAALESAALLVTLRPSRSTADSIANSERIRLDRIFEQHVDNCWVNRTAHGRIGAAALPGAPAPPS